MNKSHIHNGYNIYIKKDANFKFPNVCLVCRKNCDNESIDISGTYDRTLMFGKHIFSGVPKISIPVHQDCAIINRKNSIKRGMINLIFFFISAGAMYSIYRSVDKYLLLLSVFPVLIFDRFVLNHFCYGEPIKFRVDKSRYKFTFMNKGYAEEFESLNHNFLYKERLLNDFGAKTKH
jgi:hypothetical protein